MSTPVVAVFGGTRFPGRRVVRHLREHEFSVRIAAKHPNRVADCSAAMIRQTVKVDIHDERAVADVLLVAQHSLSLKKVMHGLRCVLDKGQIARRCLERGRCVLPIDFRCAFAKELVADESRGFANRLQLDTHSVAIVRDDLESQWYGAVQ